MSLIEQLGGYEKAKEELNWIKTYMWASKEMWMLEKELLKYRREHVIYEVNDQVVLINKPDLSKSLHRVLAVHAPTTIHVCPINQVSGNDLLILGFNASPFYLRHASDEEFKAGHRL
ncbi:hypothetical protein P255_00966 [Acinetobacter brisouii CIP 110357]|uniref:Uncharacterized protein n=1 Tax=Acinetobacter brisouii CIP 110357 TaxID=1341683 RepID=V2UTE4_9GAMM|nr:hypothetical protein [Acinetobacter brisouii]ENV48087.1 hypothetical protein F954_01154 [Acinetobacter brisouii ANC 4119]ESK51871.1 hypothetical protein P255_00966 [Acinetobacter brisouii CIP 110357]